MRTHLVMRLALHGCVNRPFYRLVVIKKHLARSSDRVIEQLGSYDPMVNEHREKVVALNFDRIKHWLACGAVTTTSVDELLGLSGYLPVHPKSVLTSLRNREAAAKQEELSTAEGDIND